MDREVRGRVIEIVKSEAREWKNGQKIEVRDQLALVLRPK